MMLPYATLPRPHHVNPTIESVRVVLAVKNFANIPGVCHIGLGVTATNTHKVLRRNGVQCCARHGTVTHAIGSQGSRHHGRVQTDYG